MSTFNMVSISKNTSDIITGSVFLFFGIVGFVFLLFSIFGAFSKDYAVEYDLSFLSFIAFQIFSIFLLEASYSLFTHSYNPKKINYYVWILIVLLVSIIGNAFALVVYLLYKLFVKVEDKKATKKAKKEKTNKTLIVFGLIFILFLFYIGYLIENKLKYVVYDQELDNSGGSSSSFRDSQSNFFTSNKSDYANLSDNYVLYEGDGFTLYHSPDWHEGLLGEDDLLFIYKSEDNNFATINMYKDYFGDISMDEIIDMYVNADYSDSNITIFYFDYGVYNDTGWGYVVYDIYDEDLYLRSKSIFVPNGYYVYFFLLSAPLSMFEEASKELDLVVSTLRFE